MAFTSTAEATSPTPQLSQVMAIEVKAAKPTACAGVRGRAAMRWSSRATGGDTARRYPAKTTKAICMERGRSVQRPPPQAATATPGATPAQTIAASRVAKVRRTAIEKASGTRALAARARASTRVDSLAGSSFAVFMRGAGFEAPICGSEA